ncbi:MFS transporter [Microbacterium sp. STN6]|uniref:MFS transporter n=1 Tax=Microbacterium sp. STN6 TaxID=2995588 RepID=UPI002260894A|nr:MFS transporter [Microbacterium sp. STN6]MCX7523342.1 MFS transporter [Microbacterium sp. STN6]
MTVTERRQPRAATRFPWAGLIVLASAVFLSVTSEMLPAGLLPDMSRSLDASKPQIGILVTIFAFTVVVTSTPLSALTRRWDRRGLMMAILAVLAISNVFTALAPTYELVVASRVLGGIAHGLFWALVGAYAGHLVPREQIGRAVAITLGGGTVAIVLGVPVGTALGHVFGWRLAFAIVGGLMVGAAVLIWRFLPRIARAGEAGTGGGTVSDSGTASDGGTVSDSRTDSDSTADAAAASVPARSRGRARLDPTFGAVLVVCVVTAVIMTGQYSFYTYIAPFMIQQMGVADGDVSGLLFLYGIAGAAGLLLAGVLGRRPTSALIVGVFVTGAAVATLAAFASMPFVAIGAMVLWGLGFGAIPPLLQTRLLHTSSAAFRDTASAIYTTAFNVGIGGGALLGAVLLGITGLGGLAWVFAGILGLSLVIVLATTRSARARRA